MVNPLKLANEWRDTLLVTTLAAYAASRCSISVIDGCLTVLMIRQIVRDTQWTWAPPRQIVGGQPIPNPRDVSDWGGLSGAAAALVGNALDRNSLFVWCIWLFVAFLNSARAMLMHGSLLPIWRAGVASWDWPRKCGGPTETQKLADWAASFGQRFQHAAGAA